MKVKDLKIGELYVLKHNYNTVKQVFTQNIKPHPKVKDIKEIRKLPKSLNYIWVGKERHRQLNQKPIMYLGSTKENFHLSGIDWQPIRKRHWCMYQGQKMILDGWAAQHFKKYLGEDNEQL